MAPVRQGSIRLFRLAGIQVFLHWSWFLVALIEINNRAKAYSSLLWNALEYLALFAIVLLHEFGHALACRQVGGEAHQIVLWPLGGVAFVNPPPRPGPTLWSIAAGPLVNVILAPILTGVFLIARQFGVAESAPSLYRFVSNVWFMNLGLLTFNVLPIYPLDGGQILRSLLWFVFGRARSLMITTVVGFVGVAGLIALAVLTQSIWIGIVAVFILLTCWQGLMHARLLARVAKLPRHQGFACPACGQPPVSGPLWRCHRCGTRFDTFETRAFCPRCATEFPMTQCLDCGKVHAFADWSTPPRIVPSES